MESARIADQLRRSLHGGAWHGPALGELLEGVGAAQADRRPHAGAHTIRELVLHTEAWVRAARRMIAGGVVRLDDSEDWPAGDTGDWDRQLEGLGEAVEKLAAAIEELPDEALSETVSGGDYSLYGLLHGVVQHNLYHAGQIAILKKGL